MEKKKKLKIIGFIFCALTIILILLTILLPIIIKNNIKSSYTKKTIPSSDNINLWAKFPGDIKTQTTHTFNVLEYTQNIPKVKDSLTLEEQIIYDNFDEKEKSILFEAKSNYTIKDKSKNESINTFSLGMFETLETFTNPTKYQKGINSLLYLINKALTEPDLFIRKLFTYYIYNSLIVDEEVVRTIILENVEKGKADKILSNDEKYAEYSFKNIFGFYKWIRILASPEDIKNAIWLIDLYNLTDNEIDSIIGKNSYLKNNYTNYNKELSNKFNCYNKNICGNEILYRQLISGDVVKSIGLEGGIYSLYQSVIPDFYPFSKSPELNLFFEEYKKLINNNDINSEDYIPNSDELNNIVNLTSVNCLLSPNNSALFLSLNETENYELAQQLFKISKNKMNFISVYIYEYLPKLFLYQEFSDTENNIYSIDPISRGIGTIAQGIIDQTYKLLNETKDFYNLILSTVVWEQLLNQSSIIEIQPDELCPLIMQKALDDGKKVLKVCSDPKTGFNSAETLLKWFEPYSCISSRDESNCDMSIINYLKTIIYITDDEIKAIYDKNSLGSILEENDKLLKAVFKCKDNVCSDDYLSKIQFWKGEISKNVPPPLVKSNTLSTIFPDKYPYPVEIFYFAEKLGYTDEISEENIDILISLVSKSKNILNEENSKTLKAKIDLEKELTLILNNKKEKKGNIYEIVNILNNGYLFNNESNTNYKNIYNILQGNSDEDKKYIEFLSSGNIFDNYKPKLNQTTGFNFGIDLNNGEEKEIQFDKYEIFAKKNEDNNKMRQILRINDLPLLNIKKLEYNCLSNDISKINSPIMNFQSLTGDKSFIDGYQYEAKEESIYFYDKISSRPFKFNYEDDSEYEDIGCKLYELDKDDLANNINEENEKVLLKNGAFLTQKLNKPFMISIGNDDLSAKIDGDISEENYICVDPFTNMVIDSKMNFIYSLFTKNYGYINPIIKNNKIYPIFTYQRNYQVDKDSYNDYFPNIKKYKIFRKIFLIVGIILIIIFAIIALWTFLKLHKLLIEEEKQMNMPDRDKLLEDSTRYPTIMNRSTEQKE